VRSTAKVDAGSGTMRSLAPLPRWITVDVAHFKVERLLKAKSTGIDGKEIGVVVGSTHPGEEFYYLLFG